MARLPTWIMLVFFGIHLPSCGDGDAPGFGSVETRPLALNLVIAPGTDITAVNFLSTTVRDDTGTTVHQECSAYSGFGLPIEVEIPTAGRATIEVNLLSGTGVCDAGGGGFLIARGVLIPNPLGTEIPENTTLPVPVRLVDGFTPTFGINTESTSPSESRYGAAHCILPNGFILLAGGATIDAPLTGAETTFPWETSDNITSLSATMEMYDPGTGAWIPLTGTATGAQELPSGRAFAEMVYLPERNAVALVGGLEESLTGEIVPSSTITLIDLETLVPYPADQSGNSIAPRAFGTVTRIESDGTSLLFMTGGIGEAANSYEVIRPGPIGASGSDHILGFGTLPRSRWNHTATHLVSGAGVEQIYLVGGEDGDKNHRLIDVFDVEGKRFFAPPGVADAVSGLDGEGRVGHSTVFIPNLNALYVIGGYTDSARSTITSRIEVIDVDTGAPLTTASDNFNLMVARANQHVIRMGNDSVLVTGGLSLSAEGQPFMAPTDEWVGPTGNQTLTGDDEVSAQSVAGMGQRRAKHQGIALPDGSVLVVGGFTLASETLHAQSIESGPGYAECFMPLPGYEAVE